MINKISRVTFINALKAGPSVFCGLVYTLPNEEVLFNDTATTEIYTCVEEIF